MYTLDPVQSTLLCAYVQGGKEKVKCAILHDEYRRCAHPPSLGREHVGG